MIVIIGAGAAGLMAAIQAAEAGAEVTVLEHNEKPGKKIYITGKGRCNVTNDCTTDEFMREVPRNGRFLYSALSAFSPQDMMALLEENGCPVEVQRGRRVFPRSEKASDVTRTLARLCERREVRVLLNRQVTEILTEKSPEGAERVTGVRVRDGELFPAEAVILATGGMSYPATGSTGDGYRLARSLGHTVNPLRPSLSALESSEGWPEKLQGLSLKNVAVTLRSGKKVLYHELGEMLFTHFGFSGPLVLEASCHLPEEGKEFSLSLDLKPGMTAEQVDARLLREIGEGGKKQLSTMLRTMLPGSLAELFPELCGLEAETPCHQITRAQRRTLGEKIKSLPLPVKGCRPLSEAVVTRGGVSVKEVNPATMESRKTAGLYFAGEVLDVDAHTGGYNLQIAFSTGALAGRKAAERTAAGK